MSLDYSPSEILRNAWSLVCTRLFFPGARLIRRPVYLRGKQGFSFGPGFTTGYRCRIEVINPREGVKLRVGKNCKLGDGVHLVASQKVTMGDDCLLASHIFISDTNHGTVDSDPRISPDARELTAAPVEIGSRVWLGEGVCVLPGARIGDGCIIGAHSVVTGEIPANCVAVGAPARVVRRYNFQTMKMERV